MSRAHWDDFRADVVIPLLEHWRAYRYPRVLAVLRAATEAL